MKTYTWVNDGALNKWDLVFRHVVFSIIHISHVYPWKTAMVNSAAVAAWFKFALATLALFLPSPPRTWRHASWFALPPEKVMCEFPERICHRQKHLWDFKYVNMMNICHCLVPYFHMLPLMLPHRDPHGYRRNQPHFAIQLRGCCCGSEQTHPESGGKFQKGPAERFFSVDGWNMLKSCSRYVCQASNSTVKHGGLNSAMRHKMS